MQGILDGPMRTHRGQQHLRFGRPGQREISGFRACLSVEFSCRLDPTESLEAGEFMVFCQSLGGNNYSLSVLLATMAAVFGAGLRMTFTQAAETGAFASDSSES